MTESHIVLVTGSLQCGGAERVLADMANYWARRGSRVTFATWSGPEVADFFQLDPRVRREWLNVPMPGTSLRHQLQASFRRVRRLRGLLKETRPAAVLSFIHTSNLLSILAALGLGTRIVVSERMQPAVDPTLSRFWKLLRRLLYRWSDVVVAQSSDAARWITENCGKDAVVIPNALRPLPLLECERQPLILAVGRLTHQKGFDLLLRAFAGIAPEFEDWRVAIAGDGRERENLVRLRNELQISERVELVGQVSDIENWMSRAGLVVQPSRFEGFPNAVLESMGMGAPVIAADCPSGPSDLIEDGVNGRLVPVEDVATLGKVMAELMSQRALRDTLGREAAKSRHLYNQDAIMAKWEACLVPDATGVRA